MTATTDRDRVSAAFKAIRKQGYVARMNFSCCSSCGYYELSQIVKKRGGAGFVFWSRQVEQRAWRDGKLVDTLNLSWAGDASKLVTALREAGLDVEHGGLDDYCINVRPAKPPVEVDCVDNPWGL